MSKKIVKIFLEMDFYLLGLILINGLLLAINIGLTRNLFLFAKYNLFFLALDIFRAWSAIYIVLPCFTRSEDFLPEAGQKFVAVLYIIVCLDSFWLTGPWGLGR